MRKFDLEFRLCIPLQGKALRQRLVTFSASESGVMTILTLFLILIIFTVGGLALDVMRHDRERLKLQSALDRAVLAAADLDQDLCPRAVINDYLSKEGLEKYVSDKDIIVEPDTCGSQNAILAGKRRVAASAEMDIEMHFMQWSGIETIKTVATSVAEESIGNVEISLVLDVSGSMAGTKLTNLKKAANDFIDEITRKSEDGKVSISIVPYSEQVSIPDFLMTELNTTGANQFANCLDFSGSDFSTTSFTAFDWIDAETGNPVSGAAVPQTLYFTNSGNADYRSSDGFVNSYTCLANNQALPSSYTYDAGIREITIMQKDAETLKRQINGMNAYGWTSIDVGLKWGLALLDESFQPLTSRLVSGSHVPAVFDDRPAQNVGSDTLKVVVLMTDGANTEQHKVNPPYHDGPSGIWWNESEQVYSFFDEDQGNFVWPDVPRAEWDGSKGWYWVRSSRQDHAYGTGTYTQTRCESYSSGTCYDLRPDDTRDATEGDGADELSWPEMWERTTKFRIYRLLRNSLGSSYAYNWYYAASEILNQPDKDPRVEALCKEADDQGVIMFSIAFEAPAEVKPLLRNCATADGAYYEATGEKIVDVFASIGSTIQNLRLTQ